LETHISFLDRIFVRLRKKDLDGKHTQSDFFIDSKKYFGCIWSGWI